LDAIPGDRPPLMADNMLGTLAKWLRVAGADCAYADGMEDDELLQVAASGRFVLTRDKLLAQRCGPMGLYVGSDQLDEQLLLVVRAFPGLLEGEPLSRCLVCNVPVEETGPDQVTDRVPEGVLERHDRFWSCPDCDRVYWMGTHWEDMLARLDRIKERTGEGQG
jgi:uncharacterized protein with PIN domain